MWNLVVVYDGSDSWNSSKWTTYEGALGERDKKIRDERVGYIKYLRGDAKSYKRIKWTAIAKDRNSR